MVDLSLHMRFVNRKHRKLPYPSTKKFFFFPDEQHERRYLFMYPPILLLIVFLISLASSFLSHALGTGGGGAGRVWRLGCLSWWGAHVRRTHVRWNGRQTLTLSVGESSRAKNNPPVQKGEELEKTTVERNRNSRVIFNSVSLYCSPGVTASL